MSVKYGLLGVLARQPRHGYELKEAFEEVAGGFWELNFGQIYSTLQRLEKEGLVKALSGEEGLDRKTYAVTNQGLREFRQWLEEPISRPRPMREELLVKIAFMDPDDPEPIMKLLGTQRRQYLQRMQAVTRRRYKLSCREETGQNLIAGLQVDNVLFHAEADLRWLEHCEARLQAHLSRRRFPEQSNSREVDSNDPIGQS